MKFDIQPLLENDKIILKPLQESDFDALYAVASDEKIWEQHPQKDRWQKIEFKKFFEEAMVSKGAFKIIDKDSNTTIGSTRFDQYNVEKNSIFIGYTFYNVASWGTGINSAVKKLMLDYIFQYVSTVLFHVGKANIRSQIAVIRLGCTKMEDNEANDFGSLNDLNYTYQLNKETWTSRAN